MNRFVIIEVDDGLSIVELPQGQSPNDVAAIHGGILVSDDIYSTYDDALDALDRMEVEYDPDDR